MAGRHEPEETRAEIARRRLAELAAAFEAEWRPVDDPPAGSAEPSTRPRLRDRHIAVVAVAATAALVVLGWWMLAGRAESIDEPVTLAPSASSSQQTPAPGDDPAELIIDVVGAVANPGIVTVPAGSRVYEAIEAAGGLTGQPDTTALNMARELADGEQLLVGIAPPAVSGEAGGGPLNLNTADQAALEELPGVGPVTATSILDWRSKNGPFRAVEDLLDVKGIGEATLDELRDHVSVS